MKTILALVISLALFGCQTTGELDPGTQERLNAALHLVCPLIPVLDGMVQNQSAGVKTAFYVAEASCPPNAPPTNVFQVLAMIAAAVTLQPLINQIKPEPKANT